MHNDYNHSLFLSSRRRAWHLAFQNNGKTQTKRASKWSRECSLFWELRLHYFQYSIVGCMEILWTEWKTENTHTQWEWERKREEQQTNTWILVPNNGTKDNQFLFSSPLNRKGNWIHILWCFLFCAHFIFSAYPADSIRLSIYFCIYPRCLKLFLDQRWECSMQLTASNLYGNTSHFRMFLSHFYERT